MRRVQKTACLAGMSVLLRTLAWIGETPIGGMPAAGLVRVVREGDREIAMLTPAGHAQHAAASDV